MLRDELYAEIERLTEMLRALRRRASHSYLVSIATAGEIRGATLALVQREGLDPREAAIIARRLVKEAHRARV